jgi:hypothetical protein
METLRLFTCDKKMLSMKRVGLNLNQTKGLPPSPAKPSDSRTDNYVETFKTKDAWELDAIDPDKLNDWAKREIKKLIKDPEAWDKRVALEKDGQAQLSAIANGNPETLLTRFDETKEQLEDAELYLGRANSKVSELKKEIADLKKKTKKSK